VTLLKVPGTHRSQSSGELCFVASVESYSFFLPRGQASHEMCLEASVAGSTFILPAAQMEQEDKEL